MLITETLLYVLMTNVIGKKTQTLFFLMINVIEKKHINFYIYFMFKICTEDSGLHNFLNETRSCRWSKGIARGV